MQVAALGLGTASVQDLALQATPPVAHPQECPAPSVVELHIAKVLKAYDEHAAA